MCCEHWALNLITMALVKLGDAFEYYQLEFSYRYLFMLCAVLNSRTVSSYKINKAGCTSLIAANKKEFYISFVKYIMILLSVSCIPPFQQIPILSTHKFVDSIAKYSIHHHGFFVWILICRNIMMNCWWWHINKFVSIHFISQLIQM